MKEKADGYILNLHLNDGIDLEIQQKRISLYFPLCAN